MISVSAVLLVFAFVFLCLAALNVPSHPRISWGWLGLAIWMLVNGLGMIK
jgi:hypothetical protein